MSTMTTAAVFAAVCVSAYAQSNQSAVQRGKYIVEEVAKCEFCHTPRNQQGQPDTGRRLMGGPLQITPGYSAPDWAAVTPRLAGQPPGTDAEMIKLLTTGIWKTSAPPKPPMHQYHMTQSDAQAVIAYLKSLGHDEAKQGK